MTIYAQHAYMTDAEREHQRRAIEVDQWVKEMEQLQANIICNVRIMVRNGASEHLLKRIAEAGIEYDERFSKIMQVCRQRLGKPKALGR